MNMSGIFDKPELDGKIYAAETWRLSRDEYNAIQCLQGLVNRDKVRLFLICSDFSLKQLDKIAESGKEIISTDSQGAPWTFVSLINEFSDYITDNGYVLYRNTEFAEGLNTACNYASVNGWLPVSVELKETAEKCGLTMKKDISEAEYTYDFLRSFFDENKDKFSKKGIAHIKSASAGLRDFAVQQRMFVCYSENNVEGKSFIKYILNETAENGMVLGWCEAEKHFVEFISKLGFSIVASDHSRNLSVLNSFECELKNTSEKTGMKPDSDKHYISLIFSDGDNVQWITNGYGEFFRGQNIKHDYPITWGIPNICQDICSAAGEIITSSVKNEKDCFMPGPSGIGYALPSAYEEKSMDAFTTATASAMLKSNLRVACILDDEPSVFAEALFRRKFGYYSRFDNIDGGIIFLDPRMYGAGEGKVWFSNDKPFLTVKKTLWTAEGYDGVTKEWMQEQANEINSYIADNDSINGYSAICVHAWSVTPENLDYFVSLLDEHIEIVNINDLVSMITENVPHRTAKP